MTRPAAQVRNVRGGGSSLIPLVLSILASAATAGAPATKPATPDPAAVQQLEKQLADLRPKAIAHIGRLTKDESSHKTARANYDALAKVYGQLSAAYALAPRVPVLDCRDREPPATGPSFTPAGEPEDPGTLRRLDNPTPLRVYLACRQIEVWNAPLESLMSPQEAQVVRLVNNYREMLGLLHLEIDATLIQAARRHSREMIQLDYHGHVSPNPAERTILMRTRNAGYHDQAWGENVAFNYPNATAAFWGWFSSPGHHRTMVAGYYTSIGVGRWDHAWTQNFGSGIRLMLISGQQRKSATVRGEVLAPQGDAKAAPPKGKSTTTIHIFDPATGKRQTITQEK